MKRAYFENNLKQNGMWAIFANQEITTDPEDFFDKMRKRPVVEEAHNAIGQLVVERENNIILFRRTAKKEYLKRLIEITADLMFCKSYIEKMRDKIRENRENGK